MGLPDNQPEGYSLTDLNKWLAERKEVKRGKDKGKEKPKGSDTKSKKKNLNGKKEGRNYVGCSDMFHFFLVLF